MLTLALLPRYGRVTAQQSAVNEAAAKPPQTRTSSKRGPKIAAVHIRPTGLQHAAHSSVKPHTATGDCRKAPAIAGRAQSQPLKTAAANGGRQRSQLAAARFCKRDLSRSSTAPQIAPAAMYGAAPASMEHQKTYA